MVLLEGTSARGPRKRKPNPLAALGKDTGNVMRGREIALAGENMVAGLGDDTGNIMGDSGMMPQGAGFPSMDELMSMLAEGGGGPGFDGSGYDAQAAALRRGGARMAGLTGQLVGNINSSAGAANTQIGGFFDHAASQAEAGRPAIAGAHDTASTNVDQTYDNLAAQLGSLPQSSADAARAAGGSGAGSTVADRVAAAAAPFQAAGESSRAGAQANLTQHSTAGQDYLTQLASAAPSEAAQAQSAVSGRAAQAVTSAQMALAEQQARIEAQAASIEGAKQRAMVEHSADTAMSTFERMMQATQLEGAMLQNLGAKQDLGFFGGGGEDPMERAQLDYQILQNEALEQEIGSSQSGTGIPDFDRALAGTDSRTQEFAQNLLGTLEREGAMDRSAEVISSLTDEQPREEEVGLGGRLLQGLLSPSPRIQRTRTVGGPTAESLDDLVEQIIAGEQDPTLARGGVDQEALLRAFRQLAG